MPLGSKLRGLQGGRVGFMCPGCSTMHQVRVEGEGRPRWDWNGNADAPTFSPSINVTTGHFVPGQERGGWCVLSGGADPCDCERCHSFVRDGRIQFLGDCTHALAGQTVDLPDFYPAQKGA